MQHDRPVWTRVDESLWRRRHASADLDRAELVAYVVNAHASVLICGEYQPRTLETAGPVLMNIVRSEMSANRDIVPVIGQRKSRNADRIRFHLVVEDPDWLEAVL